MEALQKLGIDGASILFYLVNYGLLFFILNKYVIRPLTKSMDERSSHIRNNLQEAEQLRIDFQTEMARKVAEGAERDQQLSAELAAIRENAEQQAQRLLKEAERQREQLLAKTNADITAMKDRLLSDIEQDLLSRIERIVTQVLDEARSDEKTLKTSVKTAWDRLKSSSRL